MGAFFAAFPVAPLAASYAAADDVRDGIDRGDGVPGTLTLPATADVRVGVSYGGGGDEFAGALSSIITTAAFTAPVAAPALSLREELARDMGFAITSYRQTFEWQGDEYACVRRDEPTMSELQEGGGFVEKAKYFLVVAKAEFPDGEYPTDGDLINEGAHQVKAVKGHKDPAAVQLVLAIGSADE
ncbi:MAG: hypothetical protein QOE70_4378 [Chthoniobacter sp.]|jgi:hypothetical protein|nr:hypothetical protein [Chthoniobacter sp.]